jgi:hypothetical protein
LYSKYGLYAGPRSDQFTIRSLYSFYCDQAFIVDQARQVRLYDSEIVNCGTSSVCPVEIRKGTGSTRIHNCWFEHHEGPGNNYAGHISVGMVNGYSSAGPMTKTTPAQFVTVADAMFYNPNATVGNVGHVRCLVQLGAATGVRVIRPAHMMGGSFSDLDHIIEAPSGTAYTSAEAQATIEGVPQSLLAVNADKLFKNNGTGTPDFTARVDQNSAVGQIANRHYFYRAGAAAGAESWFISTEGTPGAVYWHAPTYPTTGQKNRLKLTRAIQYSTAAPTAGTWERGDIVLNETPSAGGFVGWVCVTSGTPGGWQTFGVIST